MLEKLHIKNFESYKDVELQFSPGLNIFVGETDAGKSGIFRSMRLLLFNQPLGTSMFPLFWKGTTEVTANFSDVTVLRLKNKTKNYYKINNEKPVLVGKGALSDEILKAINMNEINFQTQISHPFLMFDSGGKRGAVLNKIAGLDNIDRSLSNSKKDELRLKNEIVYNKDQLKKFQLDLQEFDDIELIETQLTKCESLEIKIIVFNNKQQKLREVLHNIKQVDKETQKVNTSVKSMKGLETTYNIISKLKSTSKNIKNIKSLINHIYGIELKLSKIVDLSKVLILEKKIKNLSSIESRIKTTSSILSKLQFIKSNITSAERAIAEIKKQLPNRCPTCFRFVKKVEE